MSCLGRRQRGFTLIELMMVVSIIGILAAIAVPAYQDFTIRSRMAETFALAEGPQRAVAEYYERWGSMPRDNAAAGVYPAAAWRGRFVTAIRVVNGALEIDVEPLKNVQKTVFLRPATNKANPTSTFVWVCNGGPVPVGFEVQGKLRAQAMPLPKHMPAMCR